MSVRFGNRLRRWQGGYQGPPPKVGEIKMVLPPAQTLANKFCHTVRRGRPEPRIPGTRSSQAGAIALAIGISTDSRKYPCTAHA